MPRLQKNIAFFESKMRLLYKMLGLNCLSESVDGNIDHGNTFKGYHTYDSLDSIVDRFTAGRPLSGFCLDDEHKSIHVAYNLGQRKVGYTTFTFEDRDLIQQSCGAHYCRFYHSRENETWDSKLSISAFGIMLPFKKLNDFNHQFTIVYSDWEVLNCTGDSYKSQVPVSKSLFEEVLNDGMY
jgi:hypothetical protein